jgi:hypothetical protein
MATFVVLTTRITVSLPPGAERVLVEQGSTVAFPLPDTAAVVGDTSSVGRATGVSVGRGVVVGVSVGGKGVAVGIAAWVWATIVNAAATAVDCTSTALTVGMGSAPQALITVTRINRMDRLLSSFMVISPIL